MSFDLSPSEGEEENDAVHAPPARPLPHQTVSQHAPTTTAAVKKIEPGDDYDDDDYETETETETETDVSEYEDDDDEAVQPAPSKPPQPSTTVASAPSTSVGIQYVQISMRTDASLDGR